MLSTFRYIYCIGLRVPNHYIEFTWIVRYLILIGLGVCLISDNHAVLMCAVTDHWKAALPSYSFFYLLNMTKQEASLSSYRRDGLVCWWPRTWISVFACCNIYEAAKPILRLQQVCSLLIQAIKKSFRKSYLGNKYFLSANKIIIHYSRGYTCMKEFRTEFRQKKILLGTISDIKAA